MGRRILGEFEQAVLLAILRLGLSAYGVPIRHDLNKRLGRSVSVGAVYTTLERLEAKGFVTSWTGGATDERGGRAKLYFHLTAPGQVALQQSLQALDDLKRGVRWKEAVA